MATKSCGYGGHYCSAGRSFFISRYRSVNDYCIDGQRISVSDDGKVSSFYPVTSEHIDRLRLYELAKYSEYCLWHATLSDTDRAIVPLQPFNFRIEA